jgi:hypothetical protein
VLGSVLYDNQYVRSVSCAGLSALHIQNKNKSSVWSCVAVGIQIVLFSGGSQSCHCIWR